MPSPFYTPGADIFGGAMAARKQAQDDFSNRLGQLYAGGNAQAGQNLAGLDPAKADSIRKALEYMPETEQGKVKKRTDMVKKWLVSMSQEPDESTRALMWNQMLAQGQQTGADMSKMEQQYSPDALRSHLTDVLTFDEIMRTQQERRLSDSAGGSGTENERTDTELVGGDPADPVWKVKYMRRYGQPQVQIDQQTGAQVKTWAIAIPEIARKAMSVGLPINGPSQELLRGAPQSTTPASAPGEITHPGSVVNGTPVPSAPPSTTEVSGGGMSRQERERIDTENRVAELEAKRGTQYSIDQQKAAGFSARMDQADDSLNKAPDFVPNEKDILAYKFDTTRRLASDKYKLYRQAQENWITANLRRESGAVIGADEMEQEIKKYFPSPGDDTEIVRQKAESRRIAKEGMKQSAGGAYGQLKGTLGKDKSPASPTAHPADIQAILKKYGH